MTYCGTYNLTLDEGGRVTVPSCLREETSFYVSQGTGVIFLFPLSLEERDESIVKLDKQGRLNVRKYGFKDEAILLGVGKNMEMYTRRAYDAQKREDEKARDRLSNLAGMY